MEYATLIAPFAFGAIGVIGGYAVLRYRVEGHSRRIKTLETNIVGKDFCEWKHGEADKQFRQIIKMVRSVGKTQKQSNIAIRWMLGDTKRGFGLSLSEVNEILENGGSEEEEE